MKYSIIPIYALVSNGVMEIEYYYYFSMPLNDLSVFLVHGCFFYRFQLRILDER